MENRVLVKNHDEEYLSLSNSSVGVKYKHSFVKMNEGSVRQTELMTSFRYKTQKHEKIRPEPTLDTLFPGQSPMFSLTAPSNVKQNPSLKVKKGGSSPKKQIKGESRVPTFNSNKPTTKSFKNVIQYLSVIEPVSQKMKQVEISQVHSPVQNVTPSVPSPIDSNQHQFIPTQQQDQLEPTLINNTSLGFNNFNYIQPILTKSVDNTTSFNQINNNSQYYLSQQEDSTVNNNNCIDNNGQVEDYSILKELLEYTLINNSTISNFNMESLDSYIPLESTLCIPLDTHSTDISSNFDYCGISFLG